jgi:hypothetical protein
MHWDQPRKSLRGRVGIGELPSVMLELRSALQQQVNGIRTLAVRQLARERPRGDGTREE